MEVSKMSVVELDKLREQITSIDQQLLKLLAERQQCTNQVAETKITHHILSLIHISEPTRPY